MPPDSSQFNLLNYFLGEERLSQIGDRIAIEFRESHYTYHQLRDYVTRWAEQISDLGAGDGTRVALLLYDSPELVACFFAAVSVGAVCVPINTFLSSSDIAFILSDSGAEILVTESELRDRVPSLEKLALLIVETTDRETRIAGSKPTKKS